MDPTTQTIVIIGGFFVSTILGVTSLIMAISRIAVRFMSKTDIIGERLEGVKNEVHSAKQSADRNFTEFREEMREFRTTITSHSERLKAVETKQETSIVELRNLPRGARTKE